MSRDRRPRLICGGGRRGREIRRVVLGAGAKSAAGVLAPELFQMLKVIDHWQAWSNTPEPATLALLGGTSLLLLRRRRAWCRSIP